MLRLVRDDVIDVDVSPDDEIDGPQDMVEQDLQAETDQSDSAADGHEPMAAPLAEASVELRHDTAHSAASPHGDDSHDGAVESAGEADASDSGELPPINHGILEALLLSTHHPLTAGRLAELLDLPSTKPIRNAIKELNTQYESTGRSFRIDQVAGGYQILTLPEFGDSLKKLHLREADAKLTKAALETLAIIAYKQPMLRADIESIRGVACGETIRSLMEKHLVKIAGRAEEPGRPILYGTTKRFLELFGLNSLKDLPQPEALKPVEKTGT